MLVFQSVLQGNGKGSFRAFAFSLCLVQLTIMIVGESFSTAAEMDQTGADSDAQQSATNSDRLNMILRKHSHLKLDHILNEDVSENTTEICYFHGVTMAIARSDGEKIISCRLIIQRVQNVEEIIANISGSMSVEHINFPTMMSLISACNSLPESERNNNSTFSDPVPKEKNLQLSEDLSSEDMLEDAELKDNTTSSSAEKDEDDVVFDGLSTIYPGTLWCGPGDIANTFFDLGPLVEIDKCCRAHDHCPVKMRTFQTKYGLFNGAFYSKSHCECDSILHTCLTTVVKREERERKDANVVGQLFFNGLGNQSCLKHTEQVKCLFPPAIETYTQCVNWGQEISDDQPGNMKFDVLGKRFTNAE